MKKLFSFEQLLAFLHIFLILVNVSIFSDRGGNFRKSIKIYILNVIAENFLSFGQEKKSPSFDQNSHLCREIASTLLHEINAVY